jgi:GDP-D-mannose dehydratase
MATALITGLNGQDASYLAEFLLDKGYKVIGTVRGKNPHWPVGFDPKRENLEIQQLDLGYADSIRQLFRSVGKVDELYNLAAQSHVGDSFLFPEETYKVTGVGACMLMDEYFRQFSDGKFYQASTSEMTGNRKSKLDGFSPESPYGVAKTMAHYNAKRWQNMGHFACAALLYNHETIVGFMPMIVREKWANDFDIKPISEIAQFDESQPQYQSKEMSNVQVWGKSGWVDVKFASAYPHDVVCDNKLPRFINSRCGAYMATSSHVAFLEGGIEKETKDISLGDKMEKIDLPGNYPWMSISSDEAELIGMMVADGSITKALHGIGINGKFTKNNPEILKRFTELWSRITGGTVRSQQTESGFKPGNFVTQLNLVGGSDWLRSLDLYTKDKKKRIPKIILNSSYNASLSFLHGYNSCDGLKKNLCTYEFKNFKTNSATLAMGLWYLIRKTTNQELNLTIETKTDGRIFYSLNLRSDNPKGKSGAGFCKPNNEVKKILELPEYDGWFYDLETSSGEFHCGVGLLHVHNSPRRHESFVTQKICKAAVQAKIWKTLKDPMAYKPTLALGNIEACRDWGYAPQYVEIMWKIMQEKYPTTDKTIGTGHTCTVREFAKMAYEHIGLDWRDFVVYDNNLLRPNDVEYLNADPTDANNLLGRDLVTYKGLVSIMMSHQMDMQGMVL